MKLDLESLIFVDCQTTGANPKQGHLLEVAWSSADDKVNCVLVKQPEANPIPKRIQYLTGISDSEMEQAIEKENLYSQMKTDLNERSRLVIHYAQFEKPFLKDLFTSQNDLFFNEAKIYCTHQIAKRLFPQLPAKGIRGLVGFFGNPLGEMKRARCHVEATKTIWAGLKAELLKKGIASFTQLDEWLSLPVKFKKAKYEYPLDKTKRLALPESPGVYRLLGRQGNVLYVGKATSLRSRVNSYFRGQKNRDSKKLEMLTQVWDVFTTSCETPLEAAILENDEIKQFDPPYNISLKLRDRSLLFYSKDFKNFSERQDAEHPVGPFTGLFCFEQIERLLSSLLLDEFDELLFFDPLPPDDLRGGFDIFCGSENLNKATLTNFRALLCVGMKIYKRERLLAVDEGEAELESEIDSEEALLLDPIEESVTPEKIAGKFHRMLVRGARKYLRAKQQTKLLNSTIILDHRCIHFREGKITSDSTPIGPTPYAWQTLDVVTYDRMSILITEMARSGAQIALRT